jgi:hypothetical protein
MVDVGGIVKAGVLLAAYALGSVTPASLAAPGITDTVSDAELLEYASQPYDKGGMMWKRVVLGINRGAQVVATFPCSDLCPNYTVRVIHYEIPLSRCSEIGGVEKNIRVPQGIAMHDQPFCVPRVLVENWDRYVR